jgi:DNA-binding transcriptional MerR regulator
MYTIKQAAVQSGLSVAVLRAWERRYGVVHPIRTAAGYRLYDDAAVERLRTMRALIDRGWSPSSAAAALVAGTAPTLEVVPRVNIGGEVTDSRRPATQVGIHETRTAFLDAAAALDTDGLERTLDEMFSGASFELVVERDVMPALRALGDEWAAGRLDIAAEHAASQAIGRRLAAAFQAAATARTDDGPVIVGLPPDARHELGALAFAVAARRAGLPVLYLGADLPAHDWVTTARRTRARAAVIGVVTGADSDAALEVARAIGDAVPGIAIAFGGRGAPDPGLVGGWPAPAPIILPDGLRASVGQIASTISRSAS